MGKAFFIFCTALFFYPKLLFTVCCTAFSTDPIHNTHLLIHSWYDIARIRVGTVIGKREGEFIFHIATTTTLEQAHNRNTKLGGLPERHLAHQSWPPKEIDEYEEKDEMEKGELEEIEGQEREQ